MLSDTELSRLPINHGLRVMCPTCHAEPGDKCITYTGAQAEMHRPRVQKANDYAQVPEGQDLTVYHRAAAVLLLDTFYGYHSPRIDRALFGTAHQPEWEELRQRLGELLDAVRRDLPRGVY